MAAAGRRSTRLREAHEQMHPPKSAEEQQKELEANFLQGSNRYYFKPAQYAEYLKNPALDPTMQNNKALQIAADHAELEAMFMLLKDPRVNPGEAPEVIKSAFNPGGCAYTTTAIFMLLKDKRIDPSVDNNACIKLAAKIMDGPIIISMLLKDKRVDPSVNDNEPLRIAAEFYRGANIAVLLTDPRVDPACLDNIAIRIACKIPKNYGGDVISVLLADDRVDPTANNNEAIMYVVETGNKNAMMELLSDPRIDPTCRDNAPIRAALRNGDEDMVRILLHDPRVRIPEGCELMPKPQEPEGKQRRKK